MTLNAIVQGAIVAIVVLWAAWIAFGKFFPRTRTRAVRALVRQLELPSRSQWSRDLARRLRPPPDKASGCGSGCSSCDGCGIASAVPKSGEQPLKFVARK